MTLENLSRRGFALSLLASAGTLAACGNGIGGRGPATIDARVTATLSEMYRLYPNTGTLAQQANGMLVMPFVTEAGCGIGGD